MNKNVTFRKMAIIGLSVLTLFTTSARANVDLIRNGDFTVFNGPDSVPGTSTDPNSSTSILASGKSASIFREVDFWTLSDSTRIASNVRSYLFLPNTATTPGVGAIYAHGSGTFHEVLAGAPGDDSDTLPGGGGNFVGVDAAFPNTISQNIFGLLPNTTYQLSFDTAAAQENGATGTTTDFWTVTLGSTPAQMTLTPTTPQTITIPAQGFSGWMRENLVFTTPSSIPSTGEILTFVAVGQGVPPFLLLDNVSLQAVPEPASWLLVGTGLLGLLAARRSAKKCA